MRTQKQIAEATVVGNMESVFGGDQNYMEWRDNSIDILINAGFSEEEAEEFVELL